LPRQACARPKRGFTFPWDAWLRGPLREQAIATLSQGDVWKGLGLQVESPLLLWRRFERGDRRVAALQVLALLVLADYATRYGLRS
jgi:asparagine synthase (glutamine-hydrolysing)